MGTPFSKIGGNPIVLGLDGLKDEVKAGLNTPADIPTLAVGSAAALLGDPETASWMQRTTEADGAALIEAVHGNTLRWNQLAPYGNFESGSVSHWGATSQSTVRNVADNELTVTSSSESNTTVGVSSDVIGLVVGHKYLLKFSAKGDVTFGASLNSQSNIVNAALGGTAATSSYATYGGIVTYAEPSSGSARIRIASQSSIFPPTGTLTIKQVQLFDLTQMFGAGNEPSTVAEFEALYPLPYYPYDPGSLLPVRMEGVETVGFNQWDEVWEVGTLDLSTGETKPSSSNIRAKNFNACFPNTDYFVGFPTSTGTSSIFFYGEDKNFISYTSGNAAKVVTSPASARYFKVAFSSTYGTTYKGDICINISDPTRNGTYEPYWRSERTIPATDLRSAGSVYDELRKGERITRVGAVDLGTLTWTYSNDFFRTNDLNSVILRPASNYTAADAKCSKYEVASWHSGLDKSVMVGNDTANPLLVKDTDYTDAATFKAAMSGVYLFYALATPTTTPINPPLPMSYRTGAGGTERVMVAAGTTSAPPIFATRYPLDPTDLAASIAPSESAVAEANHAVGDLIMLGWTLCKVTTAIARGESIIIGTNVTRTSVAAELAALS